MNKYQKALKVVEDLKTLNFTVDYYALVHPEGKYSIWTANGFWFIALYQVDDQYVDNNFNVSKFGAVGKILVWWEVRKILSEYKKYKDKQILSKI